MSISGLMIQMGYALRFIGIKLLLFLFEHPAKGRAGKFGASEHCECGEGVGEDRYGKMFDKGSYYSNVQTAS